jgi:UDP-glucose 4-epimerase
MKILITGSLGHIGSYLIRYLHIYYPNSNIVMIDNLMTQRFSSLFNLPNDGKFTFINADVANFNLDTIIEENDIVIHLAAITDAAGSFEKANLVELNNFNSTVSVAESCLRKKSLLITLSSTSVYGTQNELVTEDCLPNELNPQSPYAETKLKEEDFIKNLVTKFGLKATICRFGTIFGISTGMRFHTAVNKFCWQAVMNEPITVWSTAFNQKRPYLDLKDAARAFKHIIDSNLFYGETYNILTLNTTVKEIVEEIKVNVPNLKIDFVSNKIMNQLSYEVSNLKFIKTGFEFNGNLNDGIKETIDLLKKSNNILLK